MNRTQYALKNASTMLVTYILTIGVSFVARSVFINQLGEQYLGLNGVFSSILSFLSISDLGMESVFAFLLYKPLARNNYDLIRNYIGLFRKIYMFVGLFVFMSGILVLPFLPLIIGSQGTGLTNVTLIYVIMLINSAASYFFTYNRTILNANQKNYVITSVTFIMGISVNILQIIFLYAIDSMVVYVSLLLISTIVTNIILSRRVLKEYPFLKQLPSKTDLSVGEKKTLFQNTIGGMSNKLGSIVVFASDNILLSIFVNLSMVGVYSNYTMIMNSITGLIQKVLGTITASVGNLSVESPTGGLRIFKKINFYITIIIFFGAPQLFSVLRPLIRIWVGEKFVLSQYIVLLIVINFVLQISRLPALTYIDAYGLQWIQKWKSVIEAFLNLLFSLVALKVFNLGLIGILLGTICSTVLFVSWYEPFIVMKHGFRLNRNQQLKQLSLVLLEKMLVIFPTVLIWSITHYVHGEGILFLFQLVIINFLISSVLFFLMFSRKKEFRELLVLVRKNK